MMPLSDVRVLDLTRLLPGPYATRMLAELGAEVIKVEDPNGGDYARWYPPLSGDPPIGGIFREVNVGKKSIALDLKRSEAKQALQILIASCDVLVDSFRPGVLKRLDLDPQALMEASPQLIYCAITGFGQTGPDRGRAGHDIGYLGRAGVLDISGPKEQPVLGGIQVADIGGAMAGFAGILAALYERERTGKGRVVDVSLYESAQAFGAAAFGVHHAGQEIRRGQEMLDGSKPCYGIYRTKDDRFLAVGALEPKFWANLLMVLELPELMGNQLDDGPSGEAAKAALEKKFSEKTLGEWTAVFREVEACVEPILTLAEAEQDPQFVARHDRAGVVRSPVRVRDWETLDDPPQKLTDAPILGADTRKVLEEAGVSAAVIDALLH